MAYWSLFWSPDASSGFRPVGGTGSPRPIPFGMMAVPQGAAAASNVAIGNENKCFFIEKSPDTVDCLVQCNSAR